MGSHVQLAEKSPVYTEISQVCRGELPISYWSPKSYLINFSVINEYKHLMIKILSSKCEIRNRNKTFGAYHPILCVL